ncbi:MULTISPECIES: ABC transporter permease [unclassified Roseitalea]|uniref:ABC transporter permease n=1 Tax=unclassified Roseitalea TaxID=2639107 RepID=UPI00273E217E|nr:MULTISPECIES: ABC transporter permease [unclassified Roseitalea]
MTGAAAIRAALVRRGTELAVLLFAISTVLFFLLRLSGDPAAVLAGDEANPETVALISARYGLDQPLIVQYWRYMASLVTLDFGESLRANQAALGLVLERLGSTLLLACLALAITAAISVPLGAWLGFRPDANARKATNAVVFVLQGVPGYIVGLLLIQLFVVEFRLLPSIGNQGPSSWILPALTLASFLVPKMVRVVAANVSEAMREDYIRTARATGAGEGEILMNHALPNALLGATALIGTQFAFLMSGSLITEVIFAWPGFGALLVDAVDQLDFPVVQAAVFVIAVLVALVNALTDILFSLLDPRLREQGR